MKLNREGQDDTAPNPSHWFLNFASSIERRRAFSRLRQSTWRELTLAIRYPNLFPRIYGVLFAFGEVPQNPCVIIMERVTPLSEVFGNNDADFRMDDMCIHPQTGRLQVYDNRLTDETHTSCNGCFAETIKPVGDVTDISNVGLDTEGRLYLLDGGNYFTEGFSLAPGWVPDKIWWLETAPDSPAHMKQTIDVSQMLFTCYGDCRAIWQKEVK